MLTPDLALACINSLKDPFVFVDTAHIIRYLNPAAISHYAEGETLLGRSILACHQPASQQMILEIFVAFQHGETERLITNNAQHRIYMRAVRDDTGKLLGYYERYEPPLSQEHIPQ